MHLEFVSDPKVPFPAYFVKAKSLTAMRQAVADHALTWLKMQNRRGSTGAIMVDIDDTLIDHSDSVRDGFQFMRHLFEEGGLMFPIHVVTARPLDQHSFVMRLLKEKGFCVQVDRLHMVPTHLYGNREATGLFKWNTYLKIGHMHNGVVARFGDTMWDVAHHSSLNTYLKHVSQRSCYIFRDPSMKGTLSAKLPGK